MLLTGTHISADEAYRIGLVHKLFPDRETMMQEAEAIAEQIKLCAPLAVQAVRRIAYTRFMRPRDEVQELAQSLKKQVSQTEDAQEGSSSLCGEAQAGLEDALVGRANG